MSQAPSNVLKLIMLPGILVVVAVSVIACTSADDELPDPILLELRDGQVVKGQ